MGLGGGGWRGRGDHGGRCKEMATAAWWNCSRSRGRAKLLLALRIGKGEFLGKYNGRKDIVNGI